MNPYSGVTQAGELLSIMRVRLKMQREGLSKPPAAVCLATEQLVKALATFDLEEEIRIETYPTPGVLGRYVRVRGAQVLAEIPVHEA
jgi:hypothetical protein